MRKVELSAVTICTSPNHRLEGYKMKDAVIEKIGFRLNEKTTEKQNKWTDERNDAHIGESRSLLGMRSFGQQHWNDMISYLSECQSLRGRCGLFGCMKNYFPSKIFHKKWHFEWKIGICKSRSGMTLETKFDRKKRFTYLLI